MRWAILDSNIYIGHWQHGVYDELLAVVRAAFIVRHSAVVLSELRRGATTREAQGLVNRLFRSARPAWVPTAVDWWEAGKLVLAIGDAQGWDRSKRRDFHNDALIALTARRHGATIVTANHRDFDLLAGRIRVSILHA